MNWTAIVDSLNIDTINPSDIIPNRRSFFKRLTKVSIKPAVFLPLASFLLPTPGRAQTPGDITGVLNFALTLEYLEDEFYKLALGQSNLIPSGDRKIFEQISKHETAHVALLKSALGTTAIAKPDFDFTAKGMFPTAFTDYRTFYFLR